MNRCFAVATVVLSMAAGTAAHGQTTLIFNNFVPTKSVYYTHGIVPFKEAVEERTQGRVQVEITTATLAPPGAQLEMVQSGVADLAIWSPSFLGNKIMLPNVASLPGSGEESMPGSVALWRTQEKYFFGANEFEGVKLLGLMRFRSKVLFTRNAQVKTLDDMSGLKIQAVPGAGPNALASLGATPIPRPQVQAHELLSSGVIDGTMTEYLAVFGFNAADEVNHALEFPEGLVASVLSLIMNEDKFDALSPQDRQVVLDAAGEAWSRILGGELDSRTPPLRDQMRADGKTVAIADPGFFEPVRDKLQALESDWLSAAAERGVDAEAARAYYLQQYEAVASE